MSVRLRLAAWFVLTMAVLVVATSAITYAVVRSDLHSEAQHSARRLARAAGKGQPNELRLDGMAGPGDRIWITDAAGKVVNETTDAAGGTLAAVRDILRDAPSGSTTARVHRADGGQAIVLLANHSVRSTLSTLLRTLVAVGIGILVAAGLLGAFLARRALLPVDRMRQQVDDIPGAALDRRITEGRPDELGRLARAFNRLLERAEHAADQQQRFVADASHELKTPVTALQGHARIISRSVDREEWEQVSESAAVVGTGDTPAGGDRVGAAVAGRGRQPGRPRRAGAARQGDRRGVRRDARARSRAGARGRARARQRLGRRRAPGRARARAGR